MVETRNGVLTPEQETILDNILVLNNKLLEVIDGPAIKLIDNQGLEKLKQKLIAKNPETEAILYEIVDLFMLGVAELVKEPA